MHPAEFRSKILSWKGIKHGYVTYTGQRKHMSLDSGPVLDRIYLRHGNKPINPILFRNQRHYAFVGRAKDIIQMQVDLIREGYPFQVIGLQADQVDDRIMHHANVLLDITYFRSAPSIQQSMSCAYCWFLGPASPSAFSAVATKTAYTTGSISHATEATLHGSFQLVESSHHSHVFFKAEQQRKTHIAYSLNPIEKWILNKSSMTSTYKLRSKIQIDIGCEIAATNKSTAPYDTQKKSSKSAPLDISIELLCLSVFYTLTGHKPSQTFKQPFIDAVRGYVLTEDIPDYLLYHQEIAPITVMKETKHECYLASILAFFHKVGTVFDKTLNEERTALEKELLEMVKTQVDEYLCLQREAIRPFDDLLREEALQHGSAGLTEFINIKKILSATLETSVSSWLSELNVYVKTGQLSEKLQALVDANPAPEAPFTKNYNKTYEKAYEFLYYMSHQALPTALTDETLPLFIEYTQTGNLPECLDKRAQQCRVRITAV